MVADAAARAVEFVGLPEAQLNLAHAVVHLATAPKSNRVTAALGRAAGGRPASSPRARFRPTCATPTIPGPGRSDTGAGYRYPHDDARGWVAQQYRPDHLEGRRYYEPSEHGAEAVIAERIRGRRGDDEGH